MLDKYFPLYILAFILTLVLTVSIEKKLLPKLIASAEQPIYTEGPKWHLKKKGTPTMGGLAFCLSSTAVLFIFGFLFMFIDGDRTALSIMLSLFYAAANALIGIVDDLKKLKHKQNAGLSPKQKLILQFFAAALFLIGRHYLLNDNTKISFAFGSIDLGVFYYPLSMFILLAVVNSANLTDGIDGLASSVAFSTSVSLFYISAALNTETSIISSVIMGAAIAFLLFNLHPAKIFMGDTGSLFFGALISACAFTLKNPIIIIFISGVYIIESLSVILQVIYYKLTKKRLFKMAPFHHHLEKCGWSENKICIVAILTTFIMSVPAYILYLP